MEGGGGWGVRGLLAQIFHLQHPPSSPPSFTCEYQACLWPGLATPPFTCEYLPPPPPLHL